MFLITSPPNHTHTHTHHPPTHRVNPITWAGQEVLLLPVGQEEDEGKVFQGLFQDDSDDKELSRL